MIRVLSLAIAVLALAGCGTASEHHHSKPVTVRTVDQGSPFRGAWLETAYALPSATWTDTTGKARTWPADGLPFPISIVFFGYTNCDDGFCQAQTALAAAAIRGLPADLREQAGLVFVTVDPARDTVEVLAKFLSGYDVPSIGLSADFSTVAKVALHFGIDVEPPPANKVQYEVAHGTQLVGFGRRHTAPVVWTAETPADDITSDLKVLAAGDW